MIGMNVIFHLAAGLLLGVLVFLWLRALQQNDLFRQLRRAAVNEKNAAPIRVESPEKLLQDVCRLLQIPCEKLGDFRLLARRIELRPLGELLLSPRPSLLRWKSATTSSVLLEIIGDEPAAEIWRQALSTAFGEGVVVVKAARGD